MDVATFERGLKLDDRVELLEAIGQGAMGAVYKATQRGVDRPVAVKVMHITALKDPESVKRFFREAQVISALDHPNIVKVYAVNTSGEGRPYMVMDYIKGVTLYDLIHQKKLTAESYLDIFTQVCQALEHAHEKDIVHRDIKPRNILLEETADGKYVVKLVDFGIARLTQPDTVPGQKITKTGAIIGSPSYMSPEQCTGRAVDSRTDIYSLGCVMYEAATGEVPFKDEDAVGLIGKHVMESAPPVEGRSQVRGLPKAIGKVIALMMEIWSRSRTTRSRRSRRERQHTRFFPLPGESAGRLWHYVWWHPRLVL
jgi:eukaryotic-like serine/threonine-protein kinase